MFCIRLLTLNRAAQVAIACTLLPKQRTTRRWSRPDVLLGLSLLTGLAVTMRLELLGLMAPLAVQAWMYDRVDWIEGSFAIVSTAISCASELISLPYWLPYSLFLYRSVIVRRLVLLADISMARTSELDFQCG